MKIDRKKLMNLNDPSFKNELDGFLIYTEIDGIKFELFEWDTEFQCIKYNLKYEDIKEIKKAFQKLILKLKKLKVIKKNYGKRK